MGLSAERVILSTGVLRCSHAKLMLIMYKQHSCGKLAKQGVHCPHSDGSMTKSGTAGLLPAWVYLWSRHQ